ncbi:hypothetical protein GCM10009841_07060 [Microlunatus panaciterrae]|uniref:Uncharacterized protein n=1 Tax=Microlunatus panaciterrae TaxID=400768 RepID=A0ABS2RI25_9ACTN|nr:hypothetical protein [Microlunatus panaciterrae]MBM7798641.1 hypothetical protein [Microlunatus panaciterrae]
MAEETSLVKSAASKLFDIRLMIGGLFALYGVMLTVYSFFTSPAELAKAADININLWLGLGMLVLGALFLLWAKLSPLQHPDAEEGGAAEDRPAERPRRRH